MALTGDNLKQTIDSTEDVKENLETTVADAKEGKIQVGAVVRLVVLIVAWINQIAVTVGGYSVPNLSDSEVYLIATAITIVATIVAYWHNNSWTLNAKTADAILEALESSGITADAVISAVCDVIDSRSKKDKESKETTTDNKDK